MRDFALEAGRLKIVRRTVHLPAQVVVTVAGESSFFRADEFLYSATRALTTFSELYGAYPWSTYTVVAESDPLSLGLEYPTIVFVSDDLPGLVVVHETAHQWFYSLVGDNQARDPWLDESLAEWATARFGDFVNDEASTVIPANVRNHPGAPVTFWGALPFRPSVWDGLYLQGVKALASFGDDDGVDCALRRYVHDNAYRTAEPRDLLAALVPAFPNARQVLEEFGAHF